MKYFNQTQDKLIPLFYFGIISLSLIQSDPQNAKAPRWRVWSNALVAAIEGLSLYKENILKKIRANKSSLQIICKLVQINVLQQLLRLQ